VAVSYVTTSRFVDFGEGDVLVADATDQAIRARLSDAKVLERAFKNGAEVYSVPGLHAKVMVLGSVAIVGSANMSMTSAESLVEAAWVTDDPATVGMASSFIHKLAEQADRIDEGFLDRINSIKLDPPRPRTPSRRRSGTRVKLPAHCTWLINVHELKRGFPKEEEAVKRGFEEAEKSRLKKASAIDWLRFTGRTRFRKEAKRGDSVIQIWRSGSNLRPERVYKHSAIVHRQEEPTCSRFYIEQSRNAERSAMRWPAFLQLAERVGIPGSIGPSSMRLLESGQGRALFLLWGR
jgi:hypothetical protein